jgi:geranylgeranyl pyrophosphate synthase
VRGDNKVSDTPQTDDLARGNHVVPVEWAEQLERERDEAREDLEFRRELYKVQENYLELARREGDEARELAEQMSESNQVLLADVKFYRQAWEQLKKEAK